MLELNAVEVGMVSGAANCAVAPKPPAVGRSRNTAALVDHAEGALLGGMAGSGIGLVYGTEIGGQSTGLLAPLGALAGAVVGFVGGGIYGGIAGGYVGTDETVSVARDWIENNALKTPVLAA